MGKKLWTSLFTVMVGATLLSCSEAPFGPKQLSNPAAPRSDNAGLLPSVRFSEIHYDNGGTDANERIEVSGPAGTDLTGWQIVLYNGNGGASYNTATLSGSIPATCEDRGVVVQSYPSNGIQNGSPDGMALVDAAGSVVEFLSYEGSFTAVGGPADGMVSTDILASEPGSGSVDGSIQRTSGGVWITGDTNTFGACNDNGPLAEVATVVVAPSDASVPVGGTRVFTAKAYDASDVEVPGVAFTWSSSADAVTTVSATGIATGVAEGDATISAQAPNGVQGSATLHVTPAPPLVEGVRISEIHYDNSGTDEGEAVEVEAPAGTDLTGWQIVLYNGGNDAPYDTKTLSGVVPATCGSTGTLVQTYPANGIQNGSPDGLALVDNAGRVIEFLSYEGTFTAASGPASGMTSNDIGVAEGSGTPVGQSLQRDDDGWWGPAPASFGACNSREAQQQPYITFSGRAATDPALPVGFEDQLFATLRDASGNEVPDATFTWSAETPSIASIDANGVMHALAAGTAVFRATASDGTTATYSLPTSVATLSTTASYGNNTEFGVPTDADPGDDYIVRRPEYTTSYNPTRGSPNWVAYDLDASDFGPVDRCDCFTFDPELPAGFTHLTTADYTGAGAAAGYGIDRGHLARSFDRTAGTMDNATTYYLSNIIPQAADLNQGPWATMENYLGDLARVENKEVYIIAGVAGSKGTVKGEGKITIPAEVWKVAVVMPRDRGLADVTRAGDLEVIAAIMPNDPGVRDVDWNNYRTTVDAVEALSGYDLLDLLPDPIETIVEAGDHEPTARAGGPYTGSEGSAITFDGAASTDPDAGDVLTYSWTFGDGGTATTASAAHVYANDGSYAVTLTVTDRYGATSTSTTTASVANVAPIVAPLPDATLLVGETYTAPGSFTDPGADPWSATADYGDGTTQPLTLAGKTFSLLHTYTAAGSYAVTVTVRDDDESGTGAAHVTVLSPSEGEAVLGDLVAALRDAGKLSAGEANSLAAKLGAAGAELTLGNAIPAVQQLGAFQDEVAALLRSGRLSGQDANALTAYAQRLVKSISGQ